MCMGLRIVSHSLTAAEKQGSETPLMFCLFHTENDALCDLRHLSLAVLDRQLGTDGALSMPGESRMVRSINTRKGSITLLERLLNEMLQSPFMSLTKSVGAGATPPSTPPPKAQPRRVTLARAPIASEKPLDSGRYGRFRFVMNIYGDHFSVAGLKTL